MADVLWERALAHLEILDIPFEVVDDLERAHGALMEIAVEYGAALGPGRDPLLETPYTGGEDTSRS